MTNFNNLFQQLKSFFNTRKLILIGITALGTLYSCQNLSSDKSTQEIEASHYIEKWNSLKKSKKGKYIKKNIAGEWMLLFTIIQDIETGKLVKIDYKEKFTNATDKVFKDKFGDDDSYSILQNNKSIINTDPNNKSNYNVIDDSLFINNQGKNSGFLTDKYQFSYISPVTQIRIGNNDVIGSRIIEVYYKKGSEYKNDLKKFTSDLRNQADNELNEANQIVDSHDSGQFYKAYTFFANNFANIKMLNLMGNNDGGKSDSIVLKSKGNLKKIDKDVSGLYFVSMSKTFDSLSKSNDVANYGEKIKPLLTALKSEINKRAQLNLDNSLLKTLYSHENNKYQKSIRDYNTYGNGEDTFLKLAAEDYLEQIAKDPSSVDIVESFKNKKTKDGWIYYVKYRAKNSFGAYVLQDALILIKHDPKTGGYYAVRSY